MCKYIYLLEVGNAEKIFVVVLTGILHLWEHEDVGHVRAYSFEGSSKQRIICACGIAHTRTHTHTHTKPVGGQPEVPLLFHEAAWRGAISALLAFLAHLLQFSYYQLTLNLN